MEIRTKWDQTGNKFNIKWFLEFPKKKNAQDFLSFGLEFFQNTFRKYPENSPKISSKN